MKHIIWLLFLPITSLCIFFLPFNEAFAQCYTYGSNTKGFDVEKVPWYTTYNSDVDGILVYAKNTVQNQFWADSQIPFYYVEWSWNAIAHPQMIMFLTTGFVEQELASKLEVITNYDGGFSHSPEFHRIIAIIAHEYGHFADFFYGEADHLSDKQSELLADYLAGFAMRSIERKYAHSGGIGNIVPQNLEDIIKLINSIGDPHDYTGNTPHGTSEERVKAFRMGYNFKVSNEYEYVTPFYDPFDQTKVVDWSTGTFYRTSNFVRSLRTGEIYRLCYLAYQRAISDITSSFDR